MFRVADAALTRLFHREPGIDRGSKRKFQRIVELPFIIEVHDRERFILERRLLLLSILDDLVRDGRQLADLEADAGFQHLQSEFNDVLNPSNICESIKAIYEGRPDWFGSRQKEH